MSERPNLRDPSRRARSEQLARQRDEEHVARVLEFLRGRPSSSAADVIEGLAVDGHRLSSWRVRNLLRYLVLRRDAVEVKHAVRGRATVLFQARATP